MKELALHLLDLVENSAKAGARQVHVLVAEDLAGDTLSFTVADDGCGMDAEFLTRVRDPFITTKAKATGLGIPFLCQAAEQCGGHVDICSVVDQGTTVKAVWQYSHWDRAPLGRMADTVTAFFAMPCRVDFEHRRIDRQGNLVWQIKLDSAEFGGPPCDVSTLAALKSFLDRQYEEERTWHEV